MVPVAGSQTPLANAIGVVGAQQPRGVGQIGGGVDELTIVDPTRGAPVESNTSSEKLGWYANASITWLGELVLARRRRPRRC